MRVTMSSLFLIALLFSPAAGADDAAATACASLAGVANLYQACLEEHREKVADEPAEDADCGCSAGAKNFHKRLKKRQEMEQKENQEEVEP